MKEGQNFQAEFRRLALSFPEAVESSHMNHPDFRVGGKIFASLGYPDDSHAVVILPPEEQREFLQLEPAVFTPAAGAWGKRGATKVLLSASKPASLQRALEIAWRNRAPKKLLKSFATDAGFDRYEP